MVLLDNIYKRLIEIEKYMYKIFEFLAVIALFLAVSSTIIQVFHRVVVIKFIHISLTYTDEFTRYILILATYLASPIVMKEGLSPVIDVFHRSLSAKGKMLLFLLIKSIILFTLLVLVKYGLLVIKNNVSYVSPMMRWPGPVVYSIPLLGCIMMIFQLFVEVLGVISQNKKPFEYDLNDEGGGAL